MADVGQEYNLSAVIKCDSCGADMVYDPELGKLHCLYCDNTRDIAKRVPSLRNFYMERSGGEVYADDDVYKCPNCGGEVELRGFQTAKSCPFCGATNIIKLEDIKGLKPDSILPFAVSRKRASEAGRRWIRRQIFAPRALKKNFVTDRFNGIYFPSFSFNAVADYSYVGRLGERRTRTVGSGENRRTETYIYWYNVSGNRSRVFEDFMIEASTQLHMGELKKISPYDMCNAEAYTREYVAGFSSERYDTSLDDSFAIARGYMDEIIRNQIISSYGADVVDYLNVNTVYSPVKFRYTMLPLWVCAYRFKDKMYRYIVNGRSGKSTGKAPVSGGKVSLVVLIALGFVAAVACLILYIGGYI